MSFKTIFIGYPAFLFHPSNSEQDINLTDFRYSRPSNEIHVAYFMYQTFLFCPSINVSLHTSRSNDKSKNHINHRNHKSRHHHHCPF